MVFFYALCKYFASFLAKQFANKLKHDIIHTRRVLGFTLLWVAWRLALHSNLGRGFSVHWRKIEAVLVQLFCISCISTKLKLHKDTEMSLLVAGLMLSTIQVNNKK